MRLLLAEDDDTLSQRIREHLVAQGFAVDIADNGIDAQHLGLEEDYDIAILDLGLPGKSGLEVLRNWRLKGRAFPVLVLTARDAWYERVDGFKAGADDYVGKPFHIEELLERLKALIRRHHAVHNPVLQVGQFQLDEERQQVHLAGSDKTIMLTGVEFRLLRYFMLNPGVPLSRTRLSEHVYDYDSDKDSNVIEVYINKLRQKLGKDCIQTRRGQGYVFAGTES